MRPMLSEYIYISSSACPCVCVYRVFSVYISFRKKRKGCAHKLDLLISVRRASGRSSSRCLLSRARMQALKPCVHTMILLLFFFFFYMRFSISDTRSLCILFTPFYALLSANFIGSREVRACSSTTRDAIAAKRSVRISCKYMQRIDAFC